jgi:serine/threonine protein kinase
MAKAGDVIGGKYRLIHPLGIGGMGAVWRAEHTQLLQQVAIKLLDARGPAAERAVKRFQREAQIAAGIRHRNIVYISDFGTDGGAPYLVMELLNGVPLSERIVVGEPLGVKTFLSLMCETLDGLAAVHAAGVVHRDMKPENIFLVRDGDTVFPKLLDFGVSRSTDRTQGHTITREGIVMGTPEYVSPEQARGRMADIRSDFYSLGVVMYEALAGRLPFQADNAADLIVAVLNADAVPLNKLRPELGDELSMLVGRCMARSPDNRFQTTAELRAAIEQCIANHPELAELSLPRRYSPQRAQTTPMPSTELSNPAASELRPTRPHWSGEHGPKPAATRSPRRIAAWGAGALAFVAGLAVIAMFSSSDSKSQAHAAAEAKAGAALGAQPSAPAPRPEVVVELFGVPPDGAVYADGVAVMGTKVRLPRGSGMHQIAVHAPGKEPWAVMHDSSTGGRYALSMLTPEPEAEPVRAAMAKKPERSERAERRAARKAKREAEEGKLLRTPDF